MSPVLAERVSAQCPVPASRPSEPGTDLPGRHDTASMPGWMGRIKQWFRPLPRGRVVDIGWALRHSKGNFIWDAPRPVMNKGLRPSHAKAVSLCPAVLDHESRLIEVACPIDARIRFQRDAQGRAGLENALGDASPIRSMHLGQMVKLVSEKEWRHPQRPILQIITPYLFLADEPVWLTQLPPFHAYLPAPWPGVLIGGRYPIDVWPRTLVWAFEWHDPAKDLILKRGDPWFTVRFETMDPSRKTRLIKAKMTPVLEEYIQGLEGVTNYLRGTFSLFDVARSRRPAKLLTPE
jgi:hypothetical protein